ncbi:MAG: glycosyltransferase family 9 protein [Armatimonadota bacterium]|nr:glycosyltransferase family 9 protein [Armatimonadota bacterium]MCX7776946.1 glycosyltransferase family 9 protein [Armatimonadota bacterium]MDW8024780.1 glycosyltransferase family 9 protein [Armatimonadota bacterium]
MRRADKCCEGCPKRLPLDGRSFKRILIVRLSSLGDVLMATPMAQALREALPDAYIGWAVESSYAPLIEGNPHLSRVHSWDRSLLGFVRLIRELRRERYELAIDPQGLLKSAIVSLLSGARYRVGFADSREGAKFVMTHRVVKEPSLHPCDMSLQLLRALGIDADVERHRMLIPIRDEERKRVNELLNLRGLSPKQFVVFAPATRWIHKHWLNEYWVELADEIYKRYEMPTALIGGKSDLPLLNAILSHSRSPMCSFGGFLSVRESAQLIGLASAVVGVDSFPVHVGYAMGTPTLILYGPTSSLKWRMATGVHIIEHELPCRPCYRHPVCRGEWTCMRMITPNQVAAALDTVLRLA